MIQLRELTKRYGDQVAVDRLTFRVDQGKVTGFLGPNGAGKSTTIRMLLGICQPDSGTATIDGATYADLPDPMRRVGAVTEMVSPHGDMTAEAHLKWVATSAGLVSVNIAEALDSVGLGSVRRRRCKTFSLGMKQRLRLAAALIADADVLILDEPTNGLDPEGIRWMRRLFRRLANDGKTVFLSSHLISEMAITADHLIVVDKGRLLSDSSTASFLDAHAGKVVTIHLANPQKFAHVLRGDGYVVVDNQEGSLDIEQIEVSEVRRIAAEVDETIDNLSVRDSSLEDAFFSVTGGGSK